MVHTFITSILIGMRTGRLKLEAVEEQYRNGIHGFIWMNPDVIHDVTTTSSNELGIPRWVFR